MKTITTLLALFIFTIAWTEEIGLECKSKDQLLVNWYRLDLDKGTVRYNTSTQNYLKVLKNLIGTELTGDVHNLMWREKELDERIKINRKSLVMQRNNLFWQCQNMNGSQIIRKRDAYFKEILKNNKI
ncbi:MAG TPA: hypothetical protein EYF97_01850 [Gammaproteobacteria bacterium]|jgi:hypothetical protein|nr:hypothetical protein [Gammaproteobacteria bacterium]